MIEAFKLLGQIAMEGARGVQADLQRVERATEKAKEKFKSFGDGMKSAGESMSTHLALPLGVLGGFAMKTASDFGSSQAIIQQELGVTGAEADKLNQTAQNLWKQGFGEDLAGVATKVASVTKSLGDLNEQDLSYVTKGLDLFEQREWGDTTESMRAIKTLMNDFGMTAQEAMDHLTAGFQNNLNYSGEFLDVVSEYGNYFVEMGMGGDQFFSILKSGAEGGAFQLDKVGMAMQEFTFRAKDSADTTKEAFTGLGLNADEMIKAFNDGGEVGKQAFEKTVTALQGVDDEMTRNKIATDLFGTGYEDLGEKAFDAMIKASEGLDDVEGATAKANEAMEKTFGERLQSTMRTAQASLEPLGVILLDLAEKALPPLIDGATKLATWFKGLSTESQMFIVIMGALGVIIPPLIIFIGHIATAIGAIIPWITKAWSLFNKLRLAFIALNPPILIVIAVVTALIAIGVLLWKNWDQISKWLGETWDKIWSKAKETWNNVTKKVEETKTKAKAYLVELVQSAVQKFSEMQTKAKEKFDKIKEAIWKPIETAKNKVGEMIDKIKGFFTNLKLKIPTPTLPKMPKFSLDTSTKTIMGKKVTFPTGFDIKWNAQGAYVDGATLIGAGEAGGEGIVPLEGKHMLPMAKQISDFLSHDRKQANQRIEVPLIVNGREIARAIAPHMDRALERERQKRTAFNS
jgi:phage-related minor tail protein